MNNSIYPPLNELQIATVLGVFENDRPAPIFSEILNASLQNPIEANYRNVVSLSEEIFGGGYRIGRAHFLLQFREKLVERGVVSQANLDMLKPCSVEYYSHETACEMGLVVSLKDILSSDGRLESCCIHTPLGMPQRFYDLRSPREVTLKINYPKERYPWLKLVV